MIRPAQVSVDAMAESPAVAEDDATKMRSNITRCKQSQSTYAGLIPTGQEKMLGLSTYRKWIKNFSTSLQEADPSAQIDVNGPLIPGRTHEPRRPHLTRVSARHRSSASSDD